MTQQWHQVLSLLFGYLGAGIAALTVLVSLRRLIADRRLYRRVRKNLPRAGAAGALIVRASGSRRLSAGSELRVPYEGTLGSAHSCDICIPVRRVHMRSAFFWMEGNEMHLVALHRDGVTVDGVAVDPGDEAVLRDGAVLCVREVKMVFSVNGGKKRRDMLIGPYVTSQRRSHAQQGRGDGLGAPGKGEARREKKLLQKEKQTKAKSADSKSAKNAKEKNLHKKTPEKTAKER